MISAGHNNQRSLYRTLAVEKDENHSALKQSQNAINQLVK